MVRTRHPRHPVWSLARLAAIPVPILISGATLALLLPFIAKPFHLDDTLYLAAAEQIRKEPLNFYGGTVHWSKTFMPQHAAQTNPPLFPYALAAASLVNGFDEVTLHLAALAPAVGAVLGFAYLAAALGATPWLAAAAAALCPAFIVSATTLMPDVWIQCFWVWACVFWVKGLRENHRNKLWAAGALVTAATLTKFFGVVLVPLLAAYALSERRRWRMWLPPLMLPVAGLLLYHLVTRHLYGVGHLALAFSFTTSTRGAGQRILDRLLTCLSLAGGCLAPPLVLLPLWARPRELVGAAAVSTAIAVLLAAVGGVGRLSFFGAEGFQWSAFLHAWIFVSGGAALLYLAASDLRRHRDSTSLFLFLWIFGTFVFSAFINWTANARTLQSIAPAVGILVARRMALREVQGRGTTRWLPLGLAICAGLSIWVAVGDYGMALASRKAVERLTAVYSGEKSRIRFQGHWGFQYYMQKAGFLPVDFKTSSFEPGNLQFIQIGGSNVVHPKKAWGRIVWKFKAPAPLGVRTMASGLAGFYSSIWGPLPFVFGTSGGYEFYLFEFTHLVHYRHR